jgi:hypothetical protein
MYTDEQQLVINNLQQLAKSLDKNIFPSYKQHTAWFAPDISQLIPDTEKLGDGKLGIKVKLRFTSTLAIWRCKTCSVFKISTVKTFAVFTNYRLSCTANTTFQFITPIISIQTNTASWTFRIYIACWVAYRGACHTNILNFNGSGRTLTRISRCIGNEGIWAFQDTTSGIGT